MKLHLISILALAGLVTLCPGLRGDPPSPNPDRSTTSPSPGAPPNAAFIQQLRKNQEETHQRTLATIAKQDELLNRATAMLDTQQEVFKRQLEDFAVYEKILATMERQQAQYQRYLDSLPTK
jgi:hypothetical protein